VVKQLLIEGIVLFMAASAIGLLGARWAAAGLIGVLPADDSGQWLKAGLDLRLLAFNTMLAAACGLLFGLIPALQATRPDIAATLKDQASQVPGGGAARLRKVMVTVQVAFSLTLLVAAALFSQSLFRLIRVDLGFRAEHLVTFSVDATLSRPTTPNAVAFYRELQDRLQTISGVVGAGASQSGPFSNSDQGGNITVEGYRTAEIGLRVALGALPADVLQMVLAEAARIVAAGILLGLAAAVALGRLVQSQLFGIEPADPWTLAGAVTLLALVTVAAAFVPAWRASKIDPLEALRYE